MSAESRSLASVVSRIIELQRDVPRINPSAVASAARTSSRSSTSTTVRAARTELAIACGVVAMKTSIGSDR